MTSITVIEKDGTIKTIAAAEGYSLMEILRDAGFAPIEGVCGGSMACATCHLYVHPDWALKLAAENEKTEDEEDILDMAFDVGTHSRLSCQIRMSKNLDGLVVAMPGTKVGW
jgi:2Fe-2S ferredoxin